MTAPTRNIGIQTPKLRKSVFIWMSFLGYVMLKSEVTIAATSVKNFRRTQGTFIQKKIQKKLGSRQFQLGKHVDTLQWKRDSTGGRGQIQVTMSTGVGNCVPLQGGPLPVISGVTNSLSRLYNPSYPFIRPFGGVNKNLFVTARGPPLKKTLATKLIETSYLN